MNYIDPAWEVTSAGWTPPQRKLRRRLLDGVQSIGVGIVLVAVPAILFVLVLSFGVVGNVGAPSNPTTKQLNAWVLRDIRGQYHYTSATKVACVMPVKWAPGQAFTCLADDRNGHLVGVLAGTVLPDSATAWRWHESFLGLGAR